MQRKKSVGAPTFKPTEQEREQGGANVSRRHTTRINMQSYSEWH